MPIQHTWGLVVLLGGIGLVGFSDIESSTLESIFALSYYVVIGKMVYLFEVLEYLIQSVRAEGRLRNSGWSIHQRHIRMIYSYRDTAF